jgi:hypothetical protein
MAVLNPPGWLQNAGSTHTAAQLRSYVGGLLGVASLAQPLIPAGGVNPYLGSMLQVTQSGSPAMSIVVKSGLAFIAGTEASAQGVYAVVNDADLTIAVTANSSGLARIDSVFFKVQDTQYSGAVDAASLVVVAGTPSGSPVHPAAPNNSVRLADIAVANGAASITNANITDTRTYFARSALPDVQIFTGSGTWNKPTGARSVRVYMVGGGGGGGGSTAAVGAQHSVGSGGGGAGYAESIIDASTLAASVTVTVGAAGAGVSGANGNAGSASSFGGTIVSAAGGSGGTFTASSAAPFGAQGANGGLGTNGSLQIKGGDGTACWGDGNFGIGGNGGNSVLGTGGAGRATGSNGANLSGNNGGGYGGGGGGALSTSTGPAATGGSGSAGIVVVVTTF